MSSCPKDMKFGPLPDWFLEKCEKELKPDKIEIKGRDRPRTFKGWRIPDFPNFFIADGESASLPFRITRGTIEARYCVFYIPRNSYIEDFPTIEMARAWIIRIHESPLVRYNWEDNIGKLSKAEISTITLIRKELLEYTDKVEKGPDYTFGLYKD